MLACHVEMGYLTLREEPLIELCIIVEYSCKKKKERKKIQAITIFLLIYSCIKIITPIRLVLFTSLEN
uniref:Uncharacterized protein n=1 Tax=Octopus bimaculoides TaxID=37653 RepID=A0A0L8G9Z4_OCTBM